MSQAIENLINAQKLAMSIRPKVGGFPYLAETLRLAGVTHNRWSLPSCQAIYITKLGPVVQQGIPLVNGSYDVAQFDRDALIRALRIDQAGQSTFQDFLQAAWAAGVVAYEVDLEKRTVTYFGVHGERYIEEYTAVQVE